jgi:hypothetical protein
MSSPPQHLEVVDLLLLTISGLADELYSSVVSF